MHSTCELLINLVLISFLTWTNTDNIDSWYFVSGGERISNKYKVHERSFIQSIDQHPVGCKKGRFDALTHLLSYEKSTCNLNR